jgi:hypothetical protein
VRRYDSVVELLSDLTFQIREYFGCSWREVITSLVLTEEVSNSIRLDPTSSHLGVASQGNLILSLSLL